MRYQCDARLCHVRYWRIKMIIVGLARFDCVSGKKSRQVKGFVLCLNWDVDSLAIMSAISHAVNLSLIRSARLSHQCVDCARGRCPVSVAYNASVITVMRPTEPADIDWTGGRLSRTHITHEIDMSLVISSARAGHIAAGHRRLLAD